MRHAISDGRGCRRRACSDRHGAAVRVHWRHLSSSNGDLPVPGTSVQQTGSIVGDFDRDGVSDVVLSFRQVAPALVLYRYRGGTWVRHVIEPDFLTVEAGGAAFDIDGDGDLDIVFGGDWDARAKARAYVQGMPELKLGPTYDSCS